MRKPSWPFPAAAVVPQPAVTIAKYAGLALGAYLVYKLVSQGVAGTSAAITRGVVGTVVDAGAGAVVGAGQAVGIPATDPDECLEALYAGRTWDASFACPATTFIRYLGGTLPPRPSDDGGLSGYRSANRNC